MEKKKTCEMQAEENRGKANGYVECGGNCLTKDVGEGSRRNGEVTVKRSRCGLKL